MRPIPWMRPQAIGILIPAAHGQGCLCTSALSRESRCRSFISWDFPKTCLKCSSAYDHSLKVFNPDGGQDTTPYFLCFASTTDPPVFLQKFWLLFSPNDDDYLILDGWCWVTVKLDLASHICSFQSFVLDNMFYAPFHHVLIVDIWNVSLLNVKDISFQVPESKIWNVWLRWKKKKTLFGDSIIFFILVYMCTFPEAKDRLVYVCARIYNKKKK